MSENLTLEQGLVRARKIINANALTAMVAVVKNGEETNTVPKGREWLLAAPRDDNFKDIPGSRRAQVAFMLMDTHLEGNAQQLEDFVKCSWWMAMISLWDLCTKENTEHNLKMLEEAYKREQAEGVMG